MIREQSYEVSTPVEHAASSGIRTIIPSVFLSPASSRTARGELECSVSAITCPSPAAARCGTCRPAEEGSIGENVTVEEDRDIDVSVVSKTNQPTYSSLKA